MKLVSLTLAAIMAVALTACGESDAKRKELQAEAYQFAVKCLKNPQDAECKEWNAKYNGGGS